MSKEKTVRKYILVTLTMSELVPRFYFEAWETVYLNANKLINIYMYIYIHIYISFRIGIHF